MCNIFFFHIFIYQNCSEYGYETPLQNSDVKEKIKQSNLKKYGCENPLQNLEIKEKMQHTYIERYGENAFIIPNFSLDSQELFEKIDEIIPYDCLYATNGDVKKSNEYKVIVEDIDTGYLKQRYLDFYIPELKFCIEYDEEHHKNQQEKDKIREQDSYTIFFNESRYCVPAIL